MAVSDIFASIHCFGDRDWLNIFKVAIHCFEAVHLSNMPDFSDFKDFVKLSEAEIIGNGHQKGAFIVQCVLDGKSCSHEIFTTIQNKDFGNCFAFNAFQQLYNDTKPYSSTKTGFNSGLKLTLFVDKDEYIGIFGQNSGARLTISNPRDFPPISTKDGSCFPPSAPQWQFLQLIRIKGSLPFWLLDTLWWRLSLVGYDGR